MPLTSDLPRGCQRGRPRNRDENRECHQSLVVIAVVGFAAVLFAPLTASAIQFTGQCDDCAFIGNPTDPGFDPLNDGLFETVNATLNLSDVTLNAAGNLARYLSPELRCC